MVCVTENNTGPLRKASANLKAALNSATFSSKKPCPEVVPPAPGPPRPAPGPPSLGRVELKPPGPPKASPPERKHKAYNMTPLRTKIDTKKIDAFKDVAEKINRLKNTVTEDTLKDLPNQDKIVGKWILDSIKKGFNKDKWLTPEDAINLEKTFIDYITSVNVANQVKLKTDTSLTEEQKKGLYDDAKEKFEEEEKAYTTFITALIKAYKGTGISIGNSENELKFQEEQWKIGSSPKPLETSFEIRNNNREKVNKLKEVTKELTRLIDDENKRTRFIPFAPVLLTKGIIDVEESKKNIPTTNTYKKYIDEANKQLERAKATLETIKTKKGAPAAAAPSAVAPATRKTRRNRRYNRKTRRN